MKPIIRSLTLIVFLYVFHATYAQNSNLIRQISAERSYTSLDSFLLRNVPDMLDGGGYYTRFSRQIMDSFNVILFEAYESHLNSGTDSNYFLRFQLLTYGDRIIYYELHDLTYTDMHRVILDYRDSSFIEKLFDLYYSFYERQTSVEAFFTDTIEYGGQCGIAGLYNPYYKTVMDSLVENYHVLELDEWLRSPVTELQAFAVEGFYSLVSSGYQLTSKQKQMITQIKSKRGTMNMCSGCRVGARPIAEALEMFTF